MTLRQQWTVVGAVALLLAVVLVAATHLLGDELFPVSVGSRAPDFVATSVSPPPPTRSLSAYRGQVVLLNVWATWCEPCKVEMPSIEKLYREFGPRGLRVLAVSVDDPGMTDAVRRYARELGLTFEILHDPARTVVTSYQITGYPETFVIARDGVIRKKFIGAADWSSDANRALVRELLGSAPPAP